MKAIQIINLDLIFRGWGVCPVVEHMCITVRHILAFLDRLKKSLLTTWRAFFAEAKPVWVCSIPDFPGTLHMRAALMFHGKEL